MPFIKDMSEKTRLHYCVDDNGKDLKTAGYLIDYLASATLDHHSREIIDVIPILITEKIPSMKNYFQKRQVSNEYLKDINRGQIKDFQTNFPIGMMCACIWDDSEKIKNEIFVSPD